MKIKIFSVHARPDGMFVINKNKKSEYEINLSPESPETEQKKLVSAWLLKNKATSWITDNERKVNSLKSNLMHLADTKQNEVMNLLLGYKNTPAQIQRYEDKYQRAKDGDFDKKTNSIIIAKNEAMKSAVRKFTDLIEEFRGFVDDLIQAGNIELAEKALSIGESFNAETSKSDVQKLIKELKA